MCRLENSINSVLNKASGLFEFVRKSDQQEVWLAGGNSRE